MCPSLPCVPECELFTCTLLFLVPVPSRLLFFAFAISDIQIAIILILEHVCLSYGSQSKPTRDEVLDQAYSRYCASDIRNEVTEKFSAPPDKYSILQYTEFILKHRL